MCAREGVRVVRFVASCCAVMVELVWVVCYCVEWCGVMWCGVVCVETLFRLMLIPDLHVKIKQNQKEASTLEVSATNRPAP